MLQLTLEGRKLPDSVGGFSAKAAIVCYDMLYFAFSGESSRRLQQEGQGAAASCPGAFCVVALQRRLRFCLILVAFPSAKQ